MRTSIFVPLVAVFWAACSSSSGGPPPTQSGGNVAGGATSTGGAFSGGATGSGGNVGGGGTSASGGAFGTGGASGAGGAHSVGGANPGKGGAGSGGAVKPGTGGAGTGGISNPGTGGASSDGGPKIGTGGAGTDGGPKAGAGGAGGVATTNPSTGGAGTGGASTSGTIDGGTVAGGNPENSGAECNVSAAPLLSTTMAKLPNPFTMHDGTAITTKAQWECRRNEIKKDIEKYEIGPKPDPSTATVKATLSGSNLSVAVTTSSGSITLKSAVSGSGSCVVIATDMDLGYVTGCTKILFSTSDVASYNSGSGQQSKSDLFYTVYPSLWGKIGNYAIWSWGVSRLIDGLDQVKDQLKIDMTKIATHGCSYAGKMALFAGVLDERVALTVAEESGGGGIDSWRASADYTKRTGVSVEKIDNTNYAWFMSSMRSLDPYKLPHDHHELIAMVAPRAIIILGNDDYDWLGDESGYKSTMAAVEVFKALGVADHIGYDFTSGHTHCSAPQTQLNSINAFVTKFLKGGTASTNIAIKPPKSGFDLTADFDWTTPTLQ